MKDLKVFSYKVQIVDRLLVVNCQTRVAYAQAILALDQEEDDLSFKMIMSHGPFPFLWTCE